MFNRIRFDKPLNISPFRQLILLLDKSSLFSAESPQKAPNSTLLMRLFLISNRSRYLCPANELFFNSVNLLLLRINVTVLLGRVSSGKISVSSKLVQTTFLSAAPGTGVAGGTAADESFQAFFGRSSKCLQPLGTDTQAPTTSSKTTPDNSTSAVRGFIFFWAAVKKKIISVQGSKLSRGLWAPSISLKETGRKPNNHHQAPAMMRRDSPFKVRNCTTSGYKTSTRPKAKLKCPWKHRRRRRCTGLPAS